MKNILDERSKSLSFTGYMLYIEKVSQERDKLLEIFLDFPLYIVPCIVSWKKEKSASILIEIVVLVRLLVRGNFLFYGFS